MPAEFAGRRVAGEQDAPRILPADGEEALRVFAPALQAQQVRRYVLSLRGKSPPPEAPSWCPRVPNPTADAFLPRAVEHGVDGRLGRELIEDALRPRAHLDSASWRSN